MRQTQLTILGNERTLFLWLFPCSCHKDTWIFCFQGLAHCCSGSSCYETTLYRNASKLWRLWPLLATNATADGAKPTKIAIPDQNEKQTMGRDRTIPYHTIPYHRERQNHTRRGEERPNSCWVLPGFSPSPKKPTDTLTRLFDHITKWENVQNLLLIFNRSSTAK